MKAIALIPARSGSKRVPNKNLAKIQSRTLLEITCKSVIQARVFDRVVVSTDCPEIAEEALRAGAEVPFLRPYELSMDSTLMIDVIRHLIHQLPLDDKEYAAIALFQPTSPFRRRVDIIRSLRQFEEYNPDSLVSVIPVPTRFQAKKQAMLDGKKLQPIDVKGFDPNMKAKAESATLYARDGPSIAIVRPKLVLSNNLYGQNVHGYVVESKYSVDIDTQDDLDYANFLAAQNSALLDC
jgi:CMP-N,N'-diacetyllegionaminic acid synthase